MFIQLSNMLNNFLLVTKLHRIFFGKMDGRNNRKRKKMLKRENMQKKKKKLMCKIK